MERHLGQGVHRFLKFDTEMFYFWCSFIGIENSKIIWRDGAEAPTMGQLLDCIYFNKHDLAQPRGQQAMRKEAGRNLLEFIHVSRIRKRLLDCLIFVKCGMDPWSEALQSKCVYNNVSMDDNKSEDRMFSVGDDVHRQGTKISKTAEGGYVEAAVILGQDTHYLKVQHLNIFRNHWQMAMLDIPNLAPNPLNLFCDPCPNADLTWVSQVVSCDGNYMVLADNTRLFNPRRPTQVALERALQTSIVNGVTCGLQIGQIFWWYWPDKGGWFSFTVQHITSNLVYEVKGADGEAFEAQWSGGQLVAFRRDKDGGLPVQWAKAPPVSDNVWTSAGEGVNCANGWGLDQMIRVDPPPGHQQSVSSWGTGSARNVGWKVGDWVWCKYSEAPNLKVVQFIAIVISIEAEHLHLRIPWSAKGLEALLNVRSVPVTSYQLGHPSVNWTDINVSKREFDACFQTIGGQRCACKLHWCMPKPCCAGAQASVGPVLARCRHHCMGQEPSSAARNVGAGALDQDKRHGKHLESPGT